MEVVTKDKQGRARPRKIVYGYLKEKISRRYQRKVKTTMMITRLKLRLRREKKKDDQLEGIVVF